MGPFTFLSFFFFFGIMAGNSDIYILYSVLYAL